MLSSPVVDESATDPYTFVTTEMSDDCTQQSV